MGTNLTLTEIKKISTHMINSYKEYIKPDHELLEYKEEAFNHDLASILRELHLTVLANDLEHEIKNVRGD